MYQVHIERDFASASFRAYLYQRLSDGSTVLLNSAGQRYVVRPEQTLARDQAFARIPEDAAQAFLGELGRALGAVEHPQQLRADFEHERGRVDKLTAALLQTNSDLIARVPLLGRGMP